MIATPLQSEAVSRLYYVQWIRILLTVLVVAHHAAEPYVAIGGGGWGDLVKETVKSDLLQILFVFNRTFFMGFFFLISAYFLDASLARHGAWGVIRNRLIRLGIPILIFVVFVFGSIGYAVYGEGLGYFEFLYFYITHGNTEFGHLWFIAHLLVYVVVYVALRAIFPVLGTFGAELDAPGHRSIFIYILVIGAVLAVVRQVWPIDTWIRFFGTFRGEPAHMPFYATLFAIGLIAGRADWFSKLKTSTAVLWFLLGIGVFVVFASMSTERLAQPDTTAFRILWAFLEPVVGVGAMLGLLVFFRCFFSGAGPLLHMFEGNIYGVYLIHLFVVIGLQMALVGYGWQPLAKFLVVLLGTLLISFPMVALFRLIPGVRSVI